MEGSDHRSLIAFREYRAKLLSKPEELFKESHPGSTLSQLLFEALREIFSSHTPEITLFPVMDFAWFALTPYTPAELCVMCTGLNEHELTMLCDDFSKQAAITGQPVRFYPIQTEKAAEFGVTDIFRLLNVNRSLVLGNPAQLIATRTAFLQSCNAEREEVLCKQFQQQREIRFGSYGERPALVEPNLKWSGGGLFDLFTINVLQWITFRQEPELLMHDEPLIDRLLSTLTKHGILISAEKERIRESFYRTIIFRHAVHARHKDNRDWFEWRDQYGLYSAYKNWHRADSQTLPLLGGSATAMMKLHYKGAKAVFRTCNSMFKHILFEEQRALPEYLEESFENSLVMKLGGLYLKSQIPVTMPLIMEIFYYRGVYDNAWFNDKLRNDILAFDGTFTPDEEAEAVTFFRKILQLERNVGKTLTAMHELDFLGKFLPAFKETQGLGQQGAYYYYTTDEHTLRSMCFLDSLDTRTNYFGKVYAALKNPELLFMALLFHDIAKPMGLEGHEVLGAELVQSFMEKFGYDETETETVAFLIRYHFGMQRVAFRRDLNRQETIDTFAALFPSVVALDYLFLLSYAILASVNPKIFTAYKEDLLITLYKKTKLKLENKFSDRELIHSHSGETHVSLKHHAFDRHLSAFDDPLYSQHFTELEIQHHIEKIESGDPLSMYFMEDEKHTKFTVITKDSNYLLSKICGTLAINAIDIHDARIFTRNDGIVVDTFSITDSNTGTPVPHERFAKIEADLRDVVSGIMQLAYEVKKSRTSWRALSRAILKKDKKIKIKFENHDVYSVILIHAPDMHGFLYQITRKLNELGVHIYFAKIATEDTTVYDAFYVLDRNRKKLSPNYYHFIESELREVIEKL